MVVVYALLALGGCVPDSVRSGGADFDLESLPPVVLEEELRIGSVDDPVQGFSRIGGVAVDGDDLIYVFDSQDAEIRVYEPEGSYLRTIGRRGAGPGEFRGGAAVFGVVGDTVWAWEGSRIADPGRITLFTREGRVLSTADVEPVFVWLADGSCGPVSPQAVTEDGLLIGDWSTGYFLGQFCPSELVPPPASLSDTVRVPRVRYDLSGQVVDTATTYMVVMSSADQQLVEVGSSQFLLPSPPSAAPLSVHRVDGSFVVERSLPTDASGGTFRLSRLDLDDDTIFSRTYGYAPIRYPGALLDAMAARAARPGIPVLTVRRDGSTQARERHAADSANGAAAIRRNMGFPEFQPPIQGVTHAGEDGSLWLPRENTGDETIRWLVIDPEGVPRGHLTLARTGFRPVWSSGDTVFFVENDEFDVPWLVRYRMR
jgi:hypothetical protein